MYKVLCLILLMNLFQSCAKTEEEEVRSAISEAKYYLSSMECSDALSVLDDVDFQEDDADYISVYASAQACKAGYKELDLFGDDLTSISSSGLIQSLAAFDSSLTEADSSLSTYTADSEAYEAMDAAITTLLSYDDDSSEQPSTTAREEKFGVKKSGDLSLQALYMLFSQIGRHFALYGNADPDTATKGEKGGGDAGNSCLFSYTTQDAVDWITATTPGTCTAATGTEGSDLLQGAETTSDIKRRLCNGIIYYNNMMDILGNVTLPASDSLGDVSSIETALNTLMLAAETAEGSASGGIFNDGDANGQDAITNLKDVTSHSVCEAENIERIEKWYAIFFETIY